MSKHDRKRNAANGTAKKKKKKNKLFRNRTNITVVSKYAKICSLGSEQCHKKWKIAKNSRKDTGEPVERVRTHYNEKIKQRRKMSPTQIKTSNEH